MPEKNPGLNETQTHNSHNSTSSLGAAGQLILQVCNIPMLIKTSSEAKTIFIYNFIHVLYDENDQDFVSRDNFAIRMTGGAGMAQVRFPDSASYVG